MNTELGKSSDNVISCSKPSSVHSVNHVDRGVSILYYNLMQNLFRCSLERLIVASQVLSSCYKQQNAG